MSGFVAQDAAFYLFAAVMLAAAAMTAAARNAVHAVLALILAIFNSAALFILLGAEFLAMMLVIIYVGAVAVLFLFVVMMLDVARASRREKLARYAPLAVAVAVLLAGELILLLHTPLASLAAPAATDPATTAAGASGGEIENTRAIGEILYTRYLVPFQTAGLILLSAMIGAILLTLRRRTDVKRQDVKRQVASSVRRRVRLVRVERGRGIG